MAPREAQFQLFAGSQTHNSFVAPPVSYRTSYCSHVLPTSVPVSRNPAEKPSVITRGEADAVMFDEVAPEVKMMSLSGA